LEVAVAQLLVRSLEDDVKMRLRQRAKRNGRSMEDEVRSILRDAVKYEDDGEPEGLGSLFVRHFAGKGLRTEIPEWRGEKPRAARFRK
jgi:plasmid stability protein